ncbi:MAG TPA: hypothetical protein VFA32_14725 [Dehalococcoidia bacterium]|nr:hypothetical protein [Dehalococcoidia bacterium]
MHECIHQWERCRSGYIPYQQHPLTFYRWGCYADYRQFWQYGYY